MAQLNEQMKLYPEGYDTGKMITDEQRGQYVEQKQVGRTATEGAHDIRLPRPSFNRSIKR